MNVLMISFYFPPYGGGAVSRIHGFVKYLPDLDVYPLVLTVKPKYYGFKPHFLDESLEKQYNKTVKIFRSEIFLNNLFKNFKGKYDKNSLLKTNTLSTIKSLIKNALRSLFIPDAKIFYWVPEAYKLGKKLMDDYDIDVIFTTVPPYSAHILGYLLSRRYDKPLILDFRDLYNSNTSNKINIIRKFISKQLERQSIAHSKRVIVTNEQAKDYLMFLHSLPNEKVKVIENGFDEDYLDYVLKEKQNDEINKFIISYIGSLNSLRTPQYFLEAIKCFHERNPDFPIQIQLVGFIDHSHKEHINTLGISSIVNIIEHISHRKALECMVNSKVLLLLQRHGDGGKTAIPGKVYEYLATGVPILSIDEGGGATSKFLNELGISSIVEYTEPQVILSELELLIKNYDQIQAKQKNIQKIMDKYSRRYESCRLAKIIKQVVAKEV